MIMSTALFMHISITMCGKKTARNKSANFGNSRLYFSPHSSAPTPTPPHHPPKFEVRLSIEEHNAMVLTPPPPSQNPIRLHDVVSGHRGKFCLLSF